MEADLAALNEKRRPGDREAFSQWLALISAGWQIQAICTARTSARHAAPS